MGGYITVSLVAAGVTFLLTFVMRWVAPRIGAIAMPGPRSVHSEPLPSLGGAAMFVGFVVAFARRVAAHAVPRGVHRQLRAARRAARGRRDVRRRRDRRPAPGLTAGEARGPGAERQRPVAPRRHAPLLPRAVRQLRVRRAVARPRRAGHRARRRRAGQRDQPHRRPRRPRRRHRAHRGRGDLPVRRPALQGRAARGLEHRAACRPR